MQLIEPTHLPQTNHYSVRQSKSYATCTWCPHCMPCLIPNRPSTHTVHSQCLLTARLFIRFIRAVRVVITHPGERNTFASQGTTCKLFWAAHLLFWKQHYNIIQSYTMSNSFQPTWWRKKALLLLTHACKTHSPAEHRTALPYTIFRWRSFKFQTGQEFL